MRRRTALFDGLLVLTLLLCGDAGAGYSVLKDVKVPSDGSLAESSSLEVTIQNGTELSGVTGGPVFSLDQYLKVDYSSNRSGYQAVVISTDNSAPASSPPYTGAGDGAGLIKVDQTTLNVPLHWVVFNDPVPGAYAFVGRANPPEPIDTSIQFFVVDKKRPDATPFPAGYASFLFDLILKFARLADAPQAGRITDTGTAYIYLGANFTGTPVGTYKSSTLSAELVTVDNGQIIAVHHKKTFTITVVCV